MGPGSSTDNHRAERGPPEDGGPPEDEEISGASEFRAQVVKMYLNNKVSALETKTLVQRAQKAGAGGVDDMTKHTAARHSQRSLMRALLKNIVFHLSIGRRSSSVTRRVASPRSR